MHDDEWCYANTDTERIIDEYARAFFTEELLPAEEMVSINHSLEASDMSVSGP